MAARSDATLWKMPSLAERSRGFSKVQLDDEDDDDVFFVRITHAPAKTSSNMASNTRRMTSVASDAHANRIFVHYPTDDVMRRNRSGVITLNELQEELRRNSASRMTSRKRRKSAGPVRAADSVGLPEYAAKLRQVSLTTFDHFTDGAMHLGERQLLRRRRESLPLPVGHLPVRKLFAPHEQSPQQQLMNLNQSKSSKKVEKSKRLRFPDMSINNAPSPNMKVWLPRGKRHELSVRNDAQEVGRFEKLRRACQKRKYGEAIERTSSFLGSRSFAEKLMTQEALDERESSILKTWTSA